MKSRAQVQEAHEHDLIRQFVTWLNSKTSSHFRVTAKPDPPDAVLCDECCSRSVWVEHADIYRNGDEAHEERSLAVPEERDYFHKEHPIVEPDQRLATRFVEILGDKLQKSSYVCVFETYGPGILILTERDPLFTRSTFERIREELNAHDFSADLGCFGHVYFGYRSFGGLRFEPIRYKSPRST